MATTINQQTPYSDDDNNALSTMLSRAYTLNWELILLAVIFLLAVFTRFYDLGERIMSHDESLHTQFSYYLFDDGNYEHDPMMHGPILFHGTAFAYYLFGDNDFSGRLYAAVLGVMLVMTPLLFRRWLGRWGTILAAFMLLISPLLMYYSRYIRHDIPSILSAVLMAWAILMYLSGPENQRRRAHWLYLLSAAMLWNLGSKETAFIYIAIFGAIGTLYWLVRMVQHFYNVKGRVVFDSMMIAFLLAGVAALMMIVVIAIAFQGVLIPDEARPGSMTQLGNSLSERVEFSVEQIGEVLSFNAPHPAFATFLNWTLMVVVLMLALVVGPALWAYRRRMQQFDIQDFAAVILGVLIFWIVSLVQSLAIGVAAAGLVGLVYAGLRLQGSRVFLRHMLVVVTVALVVCVGIIVIEELSHVPSRVGGEPAAQPVPGEAGGTASDTSDFTLLPIIGVWVLGVVVIGGLVYSRRAGWWNTLSQFPELDVLIVMGALVLPWLTAVFIFMARGSPADMIDVAQSLPDFIYNLVPTGDISPGLEAQRIGEVVIGFLAWVPMMAVAVATGITWNWRRFLVCFVIFHALFAFFFTTVFTNIEGLASGMVYSLQYWLEQQGERRGSQPQYYYLLVIMPVYEFLPVIGGVLAMVAGLVVFWRRRRAHEVQAALETGVVDEAAGIAEGTTPGLEEPPHDVAAEAEPPARERKRASDSAGSEVVEETVPIALPVVQPRLTHLPFLLFVAWWAVLNLIGYTLAGEKMPWLGTHLTVPMILLSAWYFGRIFERIDLRRLREGGWMYLIVLPLLIVTGWQIIAPYLGNDQPFAGTSRAQLSDTYTWLAVVGLSAFLVYVVFRLAESTGWQHVRQMFAVAAFVVLSVLTFRVAWMASFINYDMATEFLVYAHAGPGNEYAVDALEEISIRTTGGMDIRFAHDDGMNWPGVWYFREFPNRVYYGSNPTLQQLNDVAAVVVRDDGLAEVEPLLGQDFQRFQYIRMWWPMQEYFDLTAERINHLLDLNDADSAARRAGIFDIWWAREYDTYGAAIGRDYSLTNWSPADRMYLFIRKDIAAQVWPYGIGDGTVAAADAGEPADSCIANWQELYAVAAFDTLTAQSARPIGIAAGNERVYVAEEGANRLSIYDADGEFQGTLGQFGSRDQTGAFFDRPQGVAVGPEGFIYVADSWNYRISKFTPEGEFVTSWGEPLTMGFDAPQSPTGGLWAPRDVFVDAQGRVYVADTGNKRVRVYTSDGVYLNDIGSGGSGAGELNEPVGIAVHPDGRVFVADTWNVRISMFSSEGGYLGSFPIDSWPIEPLNRPYIALDPNRDILYVADADAGMILVYDLDGNCVGSFGRFNPEQPDGGQFAAIGGIAVDEAGYVYITDLATTRVLKFIPFPLEGEGAAAEESPGSGAVDLEFPEETTPEVEETPEIEATGESEPEMTEDAEPESTPEP